MLYEFHTHENKKRPGSVHATYLIYGTQSAKTYYATGDSQQEGEDVSMTSSPYMSSSMPQDEDTVEAPLKVMTVVREENLECETPAWHGVRWMDSEMFGSCEDTIRGGHFYSRLQL